PLREDVAAAGAGVGIEIAKAREQLHVRKGKMTDEGFRRRVLFSRRRRDAFRFITHPASFVRAHPACATEFPLLRHARMGVRAGRQYFHRSECGWKNVAARSGLRAASIAVAARFTPC